MYNFTFGFIFIYVKDLTFNNTFKSSFTLMYNSTFGLPFVYVIDLTFDCTFKFYFTLMYKFSFGLIYVYVRDLTFDYTFKSYFSLILDFTFNYTFKIYFTLTRISACYALLKFQLLRRAPQQSLPKEFIINAPCLGQILKKNQKSLFF